MCRVFSCDSYGSSSAEKWTSASPWSVDATLVNILAELKMEGGGGLHSSTFRLNVTTFCGIRWVHDLLDRGTRGGVTKTA